MQRSVLVVWALGWLGALSLSAQEPASWSGPGPPVCPDAPAPVADPFPAPEAEAPAADDRPTEVPPWQPAWGVAGLRVFAAGPKVAPNGETYHPSFSTDLNFNLWLWPSQRVYLFADLRFWGEKPENGVTNGRDGGLGFSKRQFDLQGGVAWNYTGSWEARIFGYSLNNLNRGLDLVHPYGVNDGFGVENRYYLSPEYARLGRTGFDVARATFIGAGYFPTKEMIGNDGVLFNPGMLLRTYLTQDLWDWPAYAFIDASYISRRSLKPKLLLFDLGLALRPFRSWQQWEFRLGVENTGDFQDRSVLNLWYVSARYIY